MQASGRGRTEQGIETFACNHLAKLTVTGGIASIVHRIGHPGAELLILPDVRQNRAGITFECDAVMVAYGSDERLRQNRFPNEAATVNRELPHARQLT